MDDSKITDLCIPVPPVHPVIQGKLFQRRVVRRHVGMVARQVAFIEDDLFKRFNAYDLSCGIAKKVDHKLRYDSASNQNILDYVGGVTDEGVSVLDVTPSVPVGGRRAVVPRIDKDLLVAMAFLPYSVLVTYYGEVRTVKSMVDQYTYDWFQAPFGQFVLIYTMSLSFNHIVPRSTPIAYRNFVPPILYVSYCVYGPSSRYVRYQVTSACEGQTYTTNDRTYVMREGDADGSLDVESYVSAQVYQYAMTQSFLPTNFHSSQYYGTNHYGSWSFNNHTRQLEGVLAVLDRDTTVVAPGDGIGVIARLWTGCVISGDINSVTTTSPLVAKESITETLVRCESVHDKVVVLSYVYSFLTDHDKTLLSQFSCPIVILDFHHVIQDWGPYVILGPGIVGYRFPKCAAFFSEQRVKNIPMNYNHNLLSLEGTVELLSVNDVTSYITLLTPGRPYFCPSFFLPYYRSRGCSNVRDSSTKEFRIKLAMYVSEVVPNLGSHLYFAPIGKEVWFIEHVDLAIRDMYECRTVYSCDDSPRNEAVLKNVSYYRYGSRLYFYSFVDEYREYEFDYVTRSSREAGKIYFDKDPYAHVSQKLSIRPSLGGHDVTYVVQGVTRCFKGKFRQKFSDVRSVFPFGEWCESIDYYFRRTMEKPEYDKLLMYKDSLTSNRL